MMDNMRSNFDGLHEISLAMSVLRFVLTRRDRVYHVENTFSREYGMYADCIRGVAYIRGLV